jgi:hypothetical protein
MLRDVVGPFVQMIVLTIRKGKNIGDIIAFLGTVPRKNMGDFDLGW